MLILKKIKDLKYVSTRYKVKLLIFQLLKTLKLPYSKSTHAINSLLTSFLIPYNGYLLNDNESAFMADFNGLISTNKKNSD